MNKAEVLKLLQQHQSGHAEEIAFRDRTIDFVKANENFHLRTTEAGHVTASAWVVNAERTHALLIHHKKLDRWFQMGGHIEVQDATLAEAALREAREESGLESPALLSEAVYDIDVHEIPEKNGVKAHWHFDVRFLMVADMHEPLLQSDEVKDIRWFNLDELSSKPMEQSLRRMVEKVRETVAELEAISSPGFNPEIKNAPTC